MLNSTNLIDLTNFCSPISFEEIQMAQYKLVLFNNLIIHDNGRLLWIL